jgi:hypothetical protein
MGHVDLGEFGAPRDLSPLFARARPSNFVDLMTADHLGTDRYTRVQDYGFLFVTGGRTW